jgi:hypothetical protein
VCRYIVEGKRFFLHELHLWTRNKPDASKTNLLSLDASRYHWRSRDRVASYSNLRLPISFTGGLLLADGINESLTVNMGFQPGWIFERIIELRLKQGTVIRFTNHSQRVAKIRQGILAGTIRHPDGDPGTKAWASHVFERGYSRTFGEPSSWE